MSDTSTEFQCKCGKSYSTKNSLRSHRTHCKVYLGREPKKAFVKADREPRLCFCGEIFIERVGREKIFCSKKCFGKYGNAFGNGIEDSKSKDKKSRSERRNECRKAVLIGPYFCLCNKGFPSKVSLFAHYSHCSEYMKVKGKVPVDRFAASREESLPRACAASALSNRKPRVEKACEWCNKIFKCIISSKRRFCSKSCSSCWRFKYMLFPKWEKAFSEILDSLGIRYKRQHRIRNRKHPYDFFLTDFNILIELDGCYWHRCTTCFPIKFSAEEVERIRSRDLKNSIRAIKRGYKIFRIKEHNKDLKSQLLDILTFSDVDMSSINCS